MKSKDDIIVACLLTAGVFLPTSVNSDFRESFVGAAFVLLLGFLSYFFWKFGTRPGAVSAISLPILIVLGVCTLISSDIRFGWGILASYSAIAAVLALNLRNVHLGRISSITFTVVNLIWIVFGVGVVLGISSVTEFLTSWYSQFYPELLPSMMALHKPVLTFATHSLAGFFTYLFFWLNWETYKRRPNRVSLTFALCEFSLLFAVFSFTSLAFAALACAQITQWLWKHNRKVLLACAGVLIAALLGAKGALADIVDLAWQNRELAGAALNMEGNGLLARYGEGGALRETLNYLRDHPFQPLGFTFPTFLMTGDSGIIQYLVRGSIPLLLLIYIGLYRFLRYNSPNRGYILTLFGIFLAFEVGFDALPYFRTLFLLPFLVVYLKETIPSESSQFGSSS